MRISVLIPVYNGSSYIEAAIESVLSQTFQDFEIIVVDDGSEDETASLVKKYDRVRYIYQPHSGVSAARNKALQAARSELIDFLDADDLMLPEKLKKQITYMDEHPECELVFCGYQNFLDMRATDMTSRHMEILEADHVLRCIGALTKSHIFSIWGGFNTELKFGEDTEWLTGVKIGGVNVEHIIDEVLYLRRIHTDNCSLMHSRILGKDLFKFKAESVRRSIKGRGKL